MFRSNSLIRQRAALETIAVYDSALWMALEKAIPGLALNLTADLNADQRHRPAMNHWQSAHCSAR
jgi:hypothetical protein